MSRKVRSLLLDCSWIDAKLRATGIAAFLEEYEGFARDPTARLMGQTLRLSARALASDSACLLSQISLALPTNS